MPTNEVIDYTLAILEGARDMAVDFAEIVNHPLDNLVYPISMLFYDSAIIVVAHTPEIEDSQDALAFRHYVLRNQPIYQEAVSRMQARVDGFKALGSQFSDASAPERARMISHGLTGIFAPGFVVRGARLVRKIPHNIKQWESFRAPPKFHNTIDDHQFPLPKIETLSVPDLRAVAGETKFIYVITGEGRLLISDRSVSSPILDMMGRRSEFFIHHSELAQLAPVRAAGTLTVKYGQILELDNFSGHYLPESKHLGSLVEKIFKREGFTEAHGKYKPIPTQFRSSTSKPLVTYENLLSPGIETLFTSPMTMLQLTNSIPTAINDIEESSELMDSLDALGLKDEYEIIQSNHGFSDPKVKEAFMSKVASKSMDQMIAGEVTPTVLQTVTHQFYNYAPMGPRTKDRALKCKIHISS